MSKNLVIVESPAKAKTIESYLGKEYKVVSSMGHVRDLPKEDKAIDIENGFEPKYVIPSDKKKVIDTLKKEVKNVDTVYLASDEDREGEAISWHLKEVLNLKHEQTKRIVFTEITKKSILHAIQNPRHIDLNRVNAQQARRILDRLVGFKLSPILWKKIKTGLSAGRVQSVAVRLVVEREREISRFTSSPSFRIVAFFHVDHKKVMRAEFGKRLKTEKEAMDFLQKCKGSTYSILDLDKKKTHRSPLPPFITSTLQQEAARQLSFSVIQTMVVAQKLYEAGKISYMRTDSVNLSDEAIERSAAQIEKMYGKKYVHSRRFKTKSSSAQEAHEAIRPTDFLVQNVDMDRNAQRLYELIWRRTVASQMAPATIEKTVATIGISNHDQITLVAHGEVVVFDGFMKIYKASIDEEDKNKELPPLTVGQSLRLQKMTATETHTRPEARYTEATLVKKLEEKGIGRPSTYAPTITTIQKRGYVEKESRPGTERKIKILTLKDNTISDSDKIETAGSEKNKLFPTNIAMVVNDFLVEHFSTITNYTFTADLEQEFDEIANGKLSWKDMIKQFYTPFHDTVSRTEHIERSSVQNKNRTLGKDPKSGQMLYAKLGRYGPYVQLGENVDEENDKKPRYASLRTGQFIETILLEEALGLFKLPRELGTFEQSPVQANIGRFGPYILHNKKFISIPKPEDPHEITLERAIQLIQTKRESEANKIIKTFEQDEAIQVLNGRFGPYIRAEGKNVRIPKHKDPKLLTYQECQEMILDAPEKKRRAGQRKKKK